MLIKTLKKNETVDCFTKLFTVIYLLYVTVGKNMAHSDSIKFS